MTLLKATELAKEYEGHPVLRETSVAIREGEAFALIGPTGSGKTTLIRMLDLLETPTSGRIHFDGIDVTYDKHARLEARRRMSYVQQKPVVFSMNVGDNVACGLKWRHNKSNLIKRKVDDALELVGMSDYRARNARTLSGGETQRVAIARALVTEPEILFLDEPTANLDPISTAKVEQVIYDIIREKKVAIVMATHDMVQGQQLATRIGVLLDGKLMQVGSPSEIFSSPESQRVAEFVGVENIIDGVVISNEEGIATIDIGGTAIEAVSHYAAGEEVSACIRPEDITLALAKPASSARNTFMGEITRVIAVGALARVEMDCGFPLMVLVTKRSAEELSLENKTTVYASFKATGVHIIKR